jgi:hypothetical protein
MNNGFLLGYEKSIDSCLEYDEDDICIAEAFES